MNKTMLQHYRCPDAYGRFVAKGPTSGKRNFFCFGKEATCYGAYVGEGGSDDPEGTLHDALRDVEVKCGSAMLPFDPSEVIENLRCEKYFGGWRKNRFLSALTEMYYLLRPILPLVTRRHLQKIYLRGWEKIVFPRWPVDTSVDSLLQQLLLLSIRSAGVEQIPFIWFWPAGAPSCAIMTHDVETEEGRDYSPALMNIDESFGIKASFQVVPEERYRVDEKFLSLIRSRGFEVVVHDLNHDGHLYKSREQFLKRAAKINAYGREYRAVGFRAGVLYRQQDWYDELDFEYDMSVPNVAHLDPQRGGCCTVMPYFIGDILELPVTTTQDYTLFNILNNYSTNLWEQQIQIIMRKHGLMSFIVHPDYITKTRERGVFMTLLDRLACLRERERLWITTPGEVNRWWRQRMKMSLVQDASGWKIEGEGNERAVLAYARERNGKLEVTLERDSQSKNGEVVHTR